MDKWWIKYIGLPFATQGRGPYQYDCWGLVREVYRREFGILLPSWAIEGSWKENLQTADARLQDALPQFFKLDTPEIPCIALFDSPLQGYHVGVLIDAERMLHTTLGKNACVQKWRGMENHFLGFYLPCTE